MTNLRKRMIVQELKADFFETIKNPVSLLGTFFLVTGIGLYIVGWFIFEFEGTSNALNSCVPFLLVSMMFENDVIFTRNHIFYQDIKINKDEIESVNVSKNSLISVKLQNGKSVAISQYGISNHISKFEI